jgi:DNA-binding response OmpR family regulator
VVDDSRAARQLLAASLTSEGFDVRPFSGGLELLGHPEAWDASLIVTDLDMPGQDGVALIESLRARGVEAPIAVLTGVGSEEELERALAAGADLAFEKAGLTRGAFVAAVRDLIKDRRETPKNISKETDDASE